MATVTSAGTGSGIDFESVISAMVTQKKNSGVVKTQAKVTEVNSEITAVSSFKSYLSTFRDSLTSLFSDNAYNTFKASTDQGSNNYFSVSTTSQAAAGEFDLTVKQLASSEKLTQKFGSAEEPFNNSFEAGTMTISLGTNDKGEDLGSFDITIEEGDTLEKIRQKINKNDKGVTCSLLATSSGYTMSITDKITGAGASNLSITTTPAPASADENSEEGQEGDEENSEPAQRSSLALFNTGDDYGSWQHIKAQDAIINVDGEEISSHTNSFNNNQVAGVSITVNNVSAKTLENGETGYVSNHVTVSKDTAGVADKMQNVCTQYNLLMTRLDDLSKRNTYTDGVSNNDGGPLAGDSMVRGIKTQLQSMMSGFTKMVDGNSVYSMGLSYKKDGTLMLNSTAFQKAVTETPEAVKELFSGDDGLLTRADDFLKNYTKSAGLMDKRKESLQSNVSYLQNKVDTQNDALTKYEASLRKRYGAIDAMIAGLNTNLSYLDAAMVGINASSKSK